MNVYAQRMPAEPHRFSPPSGMTSMVGAPPAGPRTLSHRSSSDDSFVFNVSDDEVMERDVDLEIEARMRSETLQPTTDAGYRVHQQQQQQQHTRTRRAGGGGGGGGGGASVPSTLSQRMLSTLQKNRAAAQQSARHRAAFDDAPENRKGSTHSMGSDIDGLVVPDPLYDASLDPVCMSDDENTSSISYSITSCKDRLEARISERLQNKPSLGARQGSIAAESEALDMTGVYTGRRTYPAETVKKVDARFSEQHEAAAARQLERERQLDLARERAIAENAVHAAAYNNGNTYDSNAYDRRHYNSVQPTIETTLDPTKGLPVAFHFQGNAAAPIDSRARPTPAMMTAPGARAVRREPSRNEQHNMLLMSLNGVEQVVSGLEGCIQAASFSSLAIPALRELELLRESTKQIRTNGTTLILAEVGRAHSEFLDPLRRLVAHAVGVQNRIERLITHIKRIV